MSQLQLWILTTENNLEERRMWEDCHRDAFFNKMVSCQICGAQERERPGATGGRRHWIQRCLLAWFEFERRGWDWATKVSLGLKAQLVQALSSFFHIFTFPSLYKKEICETSLKVLKWWRLHKHIDIVLGLNLQKFGAMLKEKECISSLLLAIPNWSIGILYFVKSGNKFRKVLSLSLGCLVGPLTQFDFRWKIAAFCVWNFFFYWCNPFVYEVAFISLWCSKLGGFS